MGARTTVSRWGASLAIRIPKPVAEQWGVREGAVVEIVPRRDEVILRKRRYDLRNCWPFHHAAIATVTSGMGHATEGAKRGSGFSHSPAR